MIYVLKLNMTNRRRARELALKTLYAAEIRNVPPEEIFEDLLVQENFRKKDEIKEFSFKLVTLTTRHLAKLDSIISDISENWSFSRINILDRNILRLGITEILFMEDIPVKVSIDEAVELGKKYSTEKSGMFINGILDKVAKKDTGDEKKSP